MNFRVLRSVLNLFWTRYTRKIWPWAWWNSIRNNISMAPSHGQSKGITSIFWPHRHALYFPLSLRNFSRRGHWYLNWVTSRPWLSGESVWNLSYSTSMNIGFTSKVSKKASSFKASNILNNHGALCCHGQTCSRSCRSLFNSSLAIATSHAEYREALKRG